MSVLVKGKELPLEVKRQELARSYRQAMTEALKAELQRGASIKTIMSWPSGSRMASSVGPVLRMPSCV